MDIVAVIPAHLASLRLGRKILIDINGLPMIEHVRRRVLLSKRIKEIYVATGDDEIKNVVESHGGKVILTKKNHKNGTYRVAEAISNISCSHVILIQGDEPLLIPDYIDIFVEEMNKSNTDKMWNAVTDIIDMDGAKEPSIVKCFLDVNKHIISCFRKTPVFSDYSKLTNTLYKIQGLIAYDVTFLNKLISLKDTSFSKLESIEQMKAIEHGYKIKSIKLPSSFPSVNTELELEIVKSFLDDNNRQKKLFKRII